MIVFYVVYFGLIAALCVFGLHRMWLVAGSRRAAGRAPAVPSHETNGDHPRVLIQLPVYNEAVAHVRRLAASAAALDWPRHRLDIQVLDDSDDGSSAAIEEAVRLLSSSGVSIEHVRRGDRAGFKAGALAFGLERSAAELVAIFDADFVIPADFLERTVPWFGDPGIAMVQARWTHMNEGHNLLTRVQAVLLDGHFRVEHRARADAGRFFNFNGTAGIWRRAAIDDAGGWRADTITEDIDISLRAWLRGWRFRYLDDLEVPSELPEHIAAYKVQQNRWVSGSAQTALRYLGAIFKSPATLARKVDTAFYLTGNATYPLLLVFLLLLPAAMVLRLREDLKPVMWLDIPFFCFATLATLIYSREVRGTRPFWSFYLIRIPFLMALGFGMAPHNSRAVWRGLAGRARRFERTPKGRASRAAERKRTADGLWIAETVIVLHLLACIALGFLTWNFSVVPFLVLFGAGFLYVLVPGLRGRSRRGPAVEVVMDPARQPPAPCRDVVKSIG